MEVHQQDLPTVAQAAQPGGNTEEVQNRRLCARQLQRIRDRSDGA